MRIERDYVDQYGNLYLMVLEEGIGSTGPSEKWYKYVKTKDGSIGIVPIVAAAIPLVQKVIPVLGKVLGKLGGIIKKDDEVIALRDRFFKAFQANGVTEAQWQPFVDKHKVKHADIPNNKLMGNYKAETQRVIEFGAEVIQNFFPSRADSFIAWMNAGTDPGEAAQKALSGQNPPANFIDTTTGPSTAATYSPPNNNVQASGFNIDTKTMVIGGLVLAGLGYVALSSKKKGRR